MRWLSHIKDILMNAVQRINSKFIRRFQISYALLTLFISFIIIPHCNHGKNIFLFDRWALYAGGPKKSIYDITWDEGHSFLFRDHRKTGAVELLNLYYMVRRKNIQGIKKDHLKSLKKLGACNRLWLVKFKGPLYKHILFKEDLKIIEKVPLCEN